MPADVAGVDWVVAGRAALLLRAQVDAAERRGEVVEVVVGLALLLGRLDGVAVERVGVKVLGDERRMPAGLPEPQQEDEDLDVVCGSARPARIDALLIRSPRLLYLLARQHS